MVFLTPELAVGLVMLEVPGDLLEGGGQIVRTTLALSALSGKPVTITKIRENRPNPGLQPQHFVAVNALAAICHAETEGVAVGSRQLRFTPHGRAVGRYGFDVGTAGSIPLILQALMPAAAFAPGPLEFELTGGTDVKWSPSIDYLRLIQLPLMQTMGYEATIHVRRRGHYPKGGGQVSAVTHPAVGGLKAVRWLERGELVGINGVSHCVKLPGHVAERQANAAKAKLAEAGFTSNIATETYPPNQDPHVAPGSGIILQAKFTSGALLGSDSLGERGKPAEAVGEEAASMLIRELSTGAPVDRHMGDIIIPYLAVAGGESGVRVSEITSHTLTNIKVAEALTGVRFHVEGELRHPATVSVQGIALTA